MAEREFRQDFEAMQADMAKLRSDFTSLAQKLIDLGKNEAGSVQDRIETEARSLVQELRQTLHETQERGQKTIKSVEQMVTEQPLVSLLAAFGIGLLLGKLLDRR